MGKLRHSVLPAKGLIQHDVQRCRRQPLLTTDDVRDFHQVVVNDIGQMVGRQLISTLVEHLVVADVALDAHLTTNEVVDQNLLTGLHLEAHHILMAGSHQLLYFLFGKRQRVAHLTAGVAVVLEILNLLTLLLQLFRGVEGNIGLAGIQQLLHVLLIDVAALALTVGTLVASEGNAFVELDAQPLETLNDILLGTRHKTIAIRVFNAEYEVAAMLLGKQIII